MKQYVNRKNKNLAIKTIISGTKEILVQYILKNSMTYYLK
nr:MAG TPA: hypothetical protein [Crassvirales sp.]DAK71252.1 MAG TPA: hypothetical protein [Caudoviricetes sp.]DAP79233.1 MAG TPA: hypothetical protein [Caudoviricetes sp.]